VGSILVFDMRFLNQIVLKVWMYAWAHWAIDCLKSLVQKKTHIANEHDTNVYID